MFESATGDLLPKTDANIFYNASTSRLSVAGSVSASGMIYAAFTDTSYFSSPKAPMVFLSFTKYIKSF